MSQGKSGRFALLEQLAADGQVYMFGNPGTVEQGFLDAMADFPQISYIETLQETIAVAIADAYARSTKKAAIVQLHSSPGLGNGVGMLYQAKRGEAPLVVIAGDAGTQYDAMDAQMAADLVAIAAPVTKWSTRVIHPTSLLRVLRKAIKIATTPPMGPVFIALPMDVLDAPNMEPVVPSTLLDVQSRPGPDAIAHIAGALAGAVRPIIIAGDGIAASRAQAELTRVAEIAGADVWEANGSEMNIPFSHPLAMGGLGHMFGDVSREIVREADVILISGTYVFPEVFPSLQNVFAHGAQIFHIDPNGYEIAKNFPVDLGVVADPKASLADLADAIASLQTDAQRAAAKARVDARAAAKVAARERQRAADRASWGATPLRPSEFMAALADRLPTNSIIFDEALTTSGDVKGYLASDEPGAFFQTRGGSLGVGVPGAIGLKLANPDRTVVGFSGDGGSMYTIQALWTAAHHDIDAKFVICNNRSYKLLKHNIQRYWLDNQMEERDFPAMFDITRPNIDFVALANGMGVPGATVERPEDIVPAIERMLATRGPFLIDLVIASDIPKHFVYHKGGQ
jgi:benzoylformate decarboxylase